MKVTHRSGEYHHIALTSEEVALLVDMCHAAACSDLLPRSRDTQQRVLRLLGEVQSNLFDTAQSVWVRKRKRQVAVAA